jgi:hypothetical protein
MELMTNGIGKTITSKELVDQINMFREKEKGIEGAREGRLLEPMAHKDILRVIRDEFDEEITGREISLSGYKDSTGRSLPMFVLSVSHGRQLLMRESKFVRRAVSKFLDELENIKILPIEQELRIHQMVASFLNMGDNAKLGMMQKFYDSKGLDKKMLPDYTSSKGTIKSASELLKENGITISAIAFNKLMIAEGLLVERTRPSTKNADKIKTFKALSELGLVYGENLQSPQNPKEVQPMYYAEKFQELCKILGIQ